MFHTASAQQIKNGLVTDVYFERTQEILKAKNLNKEVRAEFIAKGFPSNWSWAVFAGVEELAVLLKELPVDVRLMKEGTIFHPWEPVMEIHGKYLDFGRYETALLGLICQASGVATMAARCRKAAGDKAVISFGARRMHPAIAPMVERNAYVGGCDGVAVGLGAHLAGQEPVGTMPHALVLIMGDTIEATKAFHEVIEAKVGLISLIDTFNDEKFEAINVAKAMGKDLFAIRLDTPGSRRGDFLKIMEEVRWELDLRGFGHVKIFVSGGINEYQILKFNPMADGYGVGTAISNAPVVDFSMDIVEIEGKPLAKRGKRSGSKKVLRCSKCFKNTVVPAQAEVPICECGGQNEDLLSIFVEKGKIKESLPTAQAIRRYVLHQLDKVSLDDTFKEINYPAASGQGINQKFS
ncbi:MAG: nicotinate phosphoribosyltransferase [Deltaproteobacteria bacterium]|nr:nicotinate phosphoribosyltransferase [Deltaproteobacteria bacterium]MBW2300512.1 nicotinate phosphoribosyltransferase [Deltaproteobacteria bacterium]RLB28290.1 MAG: nicotinate phosphoribosyltransferase [Deltaproteobacteria bacterium]